MKTLKIFDIVKETFTGQNVEFDYNNEKIRGKVVEIIYTPVSNKCFDSCKFYFKLEDDCNYYPIGILDGIDVDVVLETIVNYTKVKTISSVAPSQYEVTVDDGSIITIHYRYGRLQVYYTTKRDDCQDEDTFIFNEIIGELWESRKTFYEIKDILEKYNIIFSKVE